MSGEGKDGDALFTASGITKRFGDVVACDDIALDVKTGEKHALLGENGAGKSTFVKMMNGVIRPDAGRFTMDGRGFMPADPAEARRRGIGMVYQHFASFEALTVAENIALALPNRSLSRIRRDIRETSEAHGLAVEPGRRVERLSAGERQRVEILRCLLQKPRLMILDEPTSVLTPQEAERLFVILDGLAAEGMAVVYISHRLNEIRRFCDRATILRRGKVVATCNPRERSAADLAEMMIGSTPAPILRAESFVGAPRLEVDNLNTRPVEGVGLRDVSFAARRGEILGIAGVAGEGQDALFAALSGERRLRRPSAIRLDGKPIGHLGPRQRRRRGAAFAPEQRLGHAAIEALPLSDNLRLTRHGRSSRGRRALRRTAKDIRDQFGVQAEGADPLAGTLSGGNLQKFVLGREIDREPGILVAAQPTWGVDAGAAAAIRGALVERAQAGSAVVVISQDLDEIFEICDRVAVLYRGGLSEAMDIDTLTPERIGLLMTGASDEEAEPAQPSDPPATEPPSRPMLQAVPTPRPASDGLSTSGTMTARWTPFQTWTRMETRP